MELGNLIFGNSRGEYEVPRDWQDEFVDFLYECGFDSYGWIVEENEYMNRHRKKWISKEGLGDQEYFENEVFIVMPYYWGDDDEIAEKSNFVYKPDGFELQWYKYPLRDSYMNKDIELDELKKMLEHCKRSMK